MALVFSCGVTWSDVSNYGTRLRTRQLFKGVFLNTFQSRLKEERERLHLSQTALGEIGGVLKQAQIKYEKGDRFPDASYLIALSEAGVDVAYVLTGQRMASTDSSLSNDERELLALFRAASLTGKAAAIGALQGAAGALGGVSQTINAPIYGTAGRDMLVNSVRGKAK